MANGESSSVFGGGFVQKACQAAKPTPGCRCRTCQRARAGERLEARCACGNRDYPDQPLVLIEVLTLGGGTDEERYAFQWMCPPCRQRGIPF